MSEKLKPFIEVKKGKNHKHFRLYTCPMCGETLYTPTKTFLHKNKAKPYTSCKYCLTGIDWSFLLKEKDN